MGCSCFVSGEPAIASKLLSWQRSSLHGWRSCDFWQRIKTLENDRIFSFLVNHLYHFLGGTTHNSCHGRKGGTSAPRLVALSSPWARPFREQYSHAFILCSQPSTMQMCELRRARAHAWFPHGMPLPIVHMLTLPTGKANSIPPTVGAT